MLAGVKIFYITTIILDYCFFVIKGNAKIGLIIYFPLLLSLIAMSNIGCMTRHILRISVTILAICVRSKKYYC